MDYFGWVNIPLIFIQLFSTASDTDAPGEIAAMALRENYICLGIGAALFLMCLIFCGLGLNALAKKEGVAPSVCAYLPILNTWYAGKIAGETRFFGSKMKRAGLYAAICEFLYVVLEGMRLVLNLLLTRGEYFVLEQVEGTEYVQWNISRSLIPAEKQWQYDMIVYSEYISLAVYLVAVIFMFVIFTALFRKYYARNPFIMSFLCTLVPFRGFVLFAVRNNARIDYDDYMRRRNEQYARRYGGYGDGMPPQQPPQPPQGGETHGDDPFEDYHEQKPQDDDVFKDF